MIMVMDFTQPALSVVVVVSFLIVSCAPSSYGELLINFALMVSSAPTLNTSGVISAVDKALEVINSGDSNVLPGVRLQYTWSSVLDTQCNRTRAVDLFSERIVSLVNETVVAVLGGGCSSATEEIATASNGSLPLISYASTSVTLSGRANLFRTVPSDESLPPALATVMQYYGWRHIAIVTEREPQFLQLLPILNGSLSQAGMAIDHFIVGMSTAETIFERDSRIFFFNTNPRFAIFQLCKAIEEGRQYPEYIWLVPGWYQGGWWRDDEAYLLTLNCSLSSLEQQLERSLTLLAHPNNGVMNVVETFNTEAYAMDAVMALALALNETLPTFNGTLAENIQLNMTALKATLQATMLTGASGKVAFTSRGNRENLTVLLQQFRVNSNGSLSRRNIARIDGVNFTYINGESSATVWPDLGVSGLPPIVYILHPLQWSIYGYVLFIVSVGVFLSLICLLFNIVFRNRKVVKLTSPNLNYVIIVGAVLLMVGNVFVPSPSTDLPMLAIFCPIARMFLSVGYDICFVVALVKTIRVAYIFWNVTQTKKKLKDWQLLLIAAGIIAIEVIFTIPLLVLIHLNGDTDVVINRDNPPFTNVQGYTVVNNIITCGNSSIHYIIYISFIITFKLVIHVAGLILAFVTRKVKIDPLNDSRYSATLIYISTLLLLVSLVFFLLVEDNNTYAAVWTTYVLVEVCVFLGLNFIPKMVSLYRDPQGDKIFGDTKTISKGQFTTSVTVDQNTNIRNQIAVAENSNKV